MKAAPSSITQTLRPFISVANRYRKDVQSLETLVNKRWDWFVSQYRAAGEWWKKIDAPVRYYLLALAADRIAFGERYQSLPAAAFAPYEEVVSALVALSKETKRRVEAGGRRA